MPHYLLVYLGGEYPATPEEGQKHFEKYQQWLHSLGDSVISPAIPCKDTHTVQADGTASAGSMSAMSGMSIISADNMDAALAAAKSCPFLELGGALEVSELLQLQGGSAQGSEAAN